MANPLPSHVEEPETEGHIKFVDIRPGPLSTPQNDVSNVALASPTPTVVNVSPEGTIRPATVATSEQSLIGTHPAPSPVQSDTVHVIPPYQPGLQVDQEPLAQPQPKYHARPSRQETIEYIYPQDPFTDPANEVVVLEPQTTNTLVQPSLRRKGRSRSGSRICLLVFWSFIFPPIAVYMVEGCGWATALNFLLCHLGFLPGIIHALVMVFAFPDYLESHKQARSLTRLEEEQRYEEKMQKKLKKKRDKERRKIHNKQGTWITVPEA